MSASKYLKSLPANQQKLAKTIHAALLEICPGYKAAPAWNGLAYKRDNNYSCMLVSYKTHLKLMFWRGLDLKDDQKQLRGSGSNIRHLRFDSEKDLNKTYLRKLLKQQFALYDRGESAERRPQRRERYAMPAFVKKALAESKLQKAYQERPPYQRNDYLGWIVSAKREKTKQNRLQQMLTELEDGNRYMKMPWKGRS